MFLNSINQQQETCQQEIYLGDTLNREPDRLNGASVGDGKFWSSGVEKDFDTGMLWNTTCFPGLDTLQLRASSLIVLFPR